MGARELFSQLNDSQLSRDIRCLWQQTDLLKCYDSYVLYRTTEIYCTSVLFTVYRNVQRPFDHRLPLVFFFFFTQCNLYIHSQSLFQNLLYVKDKCDNLVCQASLLFYKVIKSLVVSKWPVLTANHSLCTVAHNIPNINNLHLAILECKTRNKIH